MLKISPFHIHGLCQKLWKIITLLFFTAINTTIVVWVQSEIIVMQRHPSQTDQDPFFELEITDLDLTDKLPAIDITGVITHRSERRAREIEDILQIIMFFTRRKRRTAVPRNLASTTAGVSMPSHPVLPPPSRYTRGRRTAGPSPIAY